MTMTKGTPRWSDGDLACLRASYGQVPTSEIAASLGRTQKAVWVRARKDGLYAGGITGTRLPGERQARTAYFRAIDSPMKAYVLGLMAADGWIDDEGHVGIQLGEKDKSLVAVVRDELDPSGRLRTYPRRAPQQNIVRFQVGSVEMAADLARLGIVPRKTHVLTWPDELPAEFENSYVGGYFDGDGGLVTRPYLAVNVHGVIQDFLAVMRDHIEEGCGVRPYGPYRQSRVWKITKTGRGAVLVADWMRRDVPGLGRKRIPADLRAKWENRDLRRVSQTERWLGEHPDTPIPAWTR